MENILITNKLYKKEILEYLQSIGLNETVKIVSVDEITV